MEGEGGRDKESEWRGKEEGTRDKEGEWRGKEEGTRRVNGGRKGQGGGMEGGRDKEEEWREEREEVYSRGLTSTPVKEYQTTSNSKRANKA